MRLTLKEIGKMGRSDSDKYIRINDKIVSMFYFRAGYTENDFPDEECWKAREFIELSNSIKCPNANTFICTFKIFQYYLEKPEILQKYTK